MTYDLDLSADAVRARLAESADRPTTRYWAFPGTTSGRPVVGEVRGDRFWWRMRQRERSSFAPWLSGQVLSGPRGATVIIEVHSPITRPAKLFMALVALALAGLWFMVSSDRSPSAIALAGVGVSLVILFPLLGTWLMRDEERTLRAEFEGLFPGAIRTGTPNRPSE